MRTLHLVSHTHWDREWYLTFQQFRLKLVRLVDHLLDILDQDESYRHFMLDGQTIVLEDYLAVRSDREEDLRRHIQAGRILVGPWYVLPDEFLVSPEATIRNLLEGDRIARQFGPKMMIGYIPDSFGHIGQMPQILRGFGIQTASLMRGLADEPCEFWWQAPGGSRVLMANLRGGYGNAAGILSGSFESFIAEANKICADLAPHAAAPHILLMHGVDHMEPQPGTSAAVAFAEGRLGGDRLIHSTLPGYFEALCSSLDLSGLPVVTGELRSSKRHPLLPNVLSTRIWIKQRNHACETLMEKWVEPFSAWAAWMAGGSQPEKELLRSPEEIIRQSWRLLMQCHPHDSICGCSIDQVHEEMRPRFDQVEQIGEELTRQSLQTLAEEITTVPARPVDGVESAVVVFNPCAGPRTDLVSVDLEALPKNGGFELVDETGAVLPHRMVGLGSSDLANMVMTGRELRDSLGMVSDGVIMGWKIRDMEVSRENGEAYIDLSLVEKGAGDRAAWERGRQAVETLLADASVKTYFVRARTVEAARVQFVAPQVPGYGYRTFYLRGKPGGKAAPVRLSPWVRPLLPILTRFAASKAGQKLVARLNPGPGRKPPYIIENEYLRVEARVDGTLDLLDKTSGALYRGQNRLVDGGDRGDEYNYSPPTADQLVAARLKSVRVEQGKVSQTLEIELELSVPEELSPDRKARSRKRIPIAVVSRVTLIQGVPRVDIHTEIDNQARDHRLRVHFSAPFGAAAADYDGHFELVRRAVGVPPFDASWIEQPRPETCQRAFTAIADEKHGLLIANRGLPEVEVLKREDGCAEIAVTLLRCVGWLSRDDFPERKGHAGPGMPAPGAQMPGRWAFDYSIVPFGAQEPLAAYRQAYAFETPLRAAGSGLRAGGLPAAASFIQVEPGEFILSAVMAAADGRSFLVRGYNLSGDPITVSLRALRPFASAARVNLAEERQEEISTADHRTVTLQLKGHEIVTLELLPG